MREQEGKVYIGNTDKSILRDDEMYSRRLGIGIYNPDILHHFEGRPEATNGPLWLPRETQQAYDTLQESGSLMVSGEPGSGKSTVIYGLRKMFREDGTPYCYYNGHFRSTDPSHIESAMKWTQKNDGVFVWDSFDYLVATRDKIRRNTSRGKTVARAEELVEATQSHIDRGMRFVGTSHNAEWMNQKTEPDIVDRLWTPFVQDKKSQTVLGEFETTEELAAFYETVGKPEGFDDGDVSFFAALPQAFDDERAASLSTYRIAKQLCQDRRPEHNELMDRYGALKEGSVTMPDFLGAVTSYLRVKNEQTQKLMGN